MSVINLVEFAFRYFVHVFMYLDICILYIYVYVCMMFIHVYKV
jgi:hypothetical protein